MNVLHQYHRLPPKKSARMLESPLTYNSLGGDEMDRASDSPLDLSLKTRKRCADTTGTDDDIIFIAQRTPDKRMCYDSYARSKLHCEQQVAWRNSEVFKSNAAKKRGLAGNSFCGGLSQNMTRPSNVVNYRGTNFNSGRYDTFNHSNDMSGTPLKDGFTKQVVAQKHFVPDLRNGGLSETVSNKFMYSNCASRSLSDHKPLHHSNGQTGHRNLPHAQRPPEQQKYPSSPYPQSRTVQASRPAEQPVSTCRSVSAKPPVQNPSFQTQVTSTSCVLPCPSSGSELRAALSSVGRYYPSQASSLSRVVKTTSTVTQRCSPDSTFSCTNTCPQNTKFQPQPYKIDTETSLRSILENRDFIKTADPNKNPANRHLEPKMLKSTAVKNWWNGPGMTVQSFGKSDPFDPGIPKHALSGSQKRVVSTDKSCPVSVMARNKVVSGTVQNTISSNSDLEVKYETPLHISIPNDAKPVHREIHPAKAEITKTVSRDPKLTCKKHIILHAVNQDEELKMLSVPTLTKSPSTIRTESVSPSEQPPSPKMPILSPQHQNPPPLAAPFVNDPPPLEPTTGDKGNDELSFNSGVPNCTDVSYVNRSNSMAAAVAPFSRQGESALSGDKTKVVASVNEGPTKIPANGQLSAFVQTGVVSPVTLKPKRNWNSKASANAAAQLSVSSNSKRWSTPNIAKDIDWRTDRLQMTRKCIPVANVAPIVKEQTKTVTEDSFTKDCKNDVCVSKTVDLQAEIAAYKTSLRMPAKLISKSHILAENIGIAEEFGASKGRFRHLESGNKLPNLRATYGKLFGAKGISKCQNVAQKTDSRDTKERNIWESMQNISDTLSKTDSFEYIPENTVIRAENCPNTIPSSLGDKVPTDIKCNNDTDTCAQSPKKYDVCRLANTVEKQESSKEIVKHVDNNSCEMGSLSQKRHKRSMLDEIANSDGFVAEQRPSKNRGSKVDLFADPALLSREERALQKAMMRFTEMETAKPRNRNRSLNPKRQSNTRQKANQLKRKAMRRSPKKQESSPKQQLHKPCPNKKGFVDFQPEVLESRTRMQSKGIHSVGGYNRDAAYEKELVNDDRRKELKRARRRARQMADQRANARKIRREQATASRDKSSESLQNNQCLRRTAKRSSLTPVKNHLKVSTDNEKEEPQQLTLIKKESVIPDEMSPSKVKARLALNHLDELPDLIQEAKCEDIEGCWEVRNLANSDALRQTLRSGRKKGGILMKLSWRPMTAASKGKPRIAHARAANRNVQGSKSVRMLRLRRRAKLAYMQVSQCDNKQTFRTNDEMNRNHIRTRPVRRRKCVSKMLTRSRIENPKSFADHDRRQTRLQLRRQQERRAVCTRTRKSLRLKKVTNSRYPLRDQTFRDNDVDDGNTTEEYDLEGDDTVGYGEEQSVCDEETVTGKGFLKSEQLSEFPEPPELRKLYINKNSGETLLHRAARLGYEEVALYCLQTGIVDANARDNAGYTPLHEGCSGGHYVIVRHLLSHGADPNCCSQDGVRPIKYAVENESTDIARLLLSYGADPLLDVCEDTASESFGLLNGYLGDINGYQAPGEEAVWNFYGSSVTEIENGVEHNLFSNVPSDSEEDESENMFDCSETRQFVSYRLKVPEAEREDNYVILADILQEYDMTRATFLRELGPRIRIFSLSRNTLEEEVTHASTICPSLSPRVKRSQTIEVIRLSDLHILRTHRSSSTKGKRVCIKQSNEFGIPDGSLARTTKVTRRLFDPDEEYPCGMPPKLMSRTLDDLSNTEGSEIPFSVRHSSSETRSTYKSTAQRCPESPLSTRRRNQTHRSSITDVQKPVFTMDRDSTQVPPAFFDPKERLLSLNNSLPRSEVLNHKSVGKQGFVNGENVDWITVCPNDVNLDIKNNNNGSKNNTDIYSIFTDDRRSIYEDIPNFPALNR